MAGHVVARSALSGQPLGCAESVEEVQQQIRRQLGVSSALGFQQPWVAQECWFTMENPSKIDDLGVPP